MIDTTRRRIFYCACVTPEMHGRAGPCDPEFTWYEPQDIEKGYRLARQRGYPEGFWAPYKLCSSCRWNGCGNTRLDNST